jgi:hypothetical protein
MPTMIRPSLRGALGLFGYLIVGYFVGGMIGGLIFALFVHEAPGGGSGNSRFAYQWGVVGGLIGCAAAFGLWYWKGVRTRGKVEVDD